jgi:hypothetical protein
MVDDKSFTPELYLSNNREGSIMEIGKTIAYHLDKEGLDMKIYRKRDLMYLMPNSVRHGIGSFIWRRVGNSIFSVCR